MHLAPLVAWCLSLASLDVSKSPMDGISLRLCCLLCEIKSTSFRTRAVFPPNQKSPVPRSHLRPAVGCPHEHSTTLAAHPAVPFTAERWSDLEVELCLRRITSVLSAARRSSTLERPSSTDQQAACAAQPAAAAAPAAMAARETAAGGSGGRGGECGAAPKLPKVFVRREANDPSAGGGGGVVSQHLFFAEPGQTNGPIGVLPPRSARARRPSYTLQLRAVDL